MRIIVQPGDGVKPIVDAIDQAKERVEIAIFRFDRSEIEKALVRAAERGVLVHALIAYTNRGGERHLRQLEMRLLEKGITVARTADDLVRYHGKYLIIDRKQLLLLAFNYTYLDMEHSRSFGLVIKDEELVAEAVKLFSADCTRQSYEPASNRFLVSPLNARNELARFIEGAKSELCIYDPKVDDPRMLRLLDEQARKGVNVRIIGEVTKSTLVPNRELGPMRLHTRSIVRDQDEFFLGSQSLRASELETRREVGVIATDKKIARVIRETFEDDWAQSAQDSQRKPKRPRASKAAHKVAKVIARELPAVTPVVELVIQEVVGDKIDVELNAGKLEESVKDAVKAAVEESVREIVEKVVENGRVAG